MLIRNAEQQGMGHKSDAAIFSISDILANHESLWYELPAFSISPVKDNGWVFPHNAVTDAKHNQPYWQ